MAKKTQQSRSIPAKNSSKNSGARTPPSAPKSAKRATQEATPTKAAAGDDAEQPRSRTPLRAVPSEQVAAAEEAAPPGRWPNLPQGAREVLGLYEQRASELCFPGVTFESLATHAERIDELSKNVEKARLELVAAQAAQGAAEMEFVETTRRAFAYAQVFAQAHEELRTDLEKFAYASADKPRRKKREGGEIQPRDKQAANSAADEAATGDEADG